VAWTSRSAAAGPRPSSCSASPAEQHSSGESHARQCTTLTVGDDVVVAPLRRGTHGAGVALMILGGAAVVVGPIAGGGGGTVVIVRGLV
jgi:hypothetical protein